MEEECIGPGDPRLPVSCAVWENRRLDRMEINSPTGSALLDTLVRSRTEAARLVHGCASATSGCHHTLREICQQPDTWRDTAERMPRHAGLIREVLALSLIHI